MFNVLAQRLPHFMLLRIGPQDLPSSRSLLQFGALLFVIVAVVRLQSIGSLSSAIVHAALELIMMSIFFKVVLGWKDAPERFTQSMTGWLYATIILGLLILMPMQALTPILLAISENPEIPVESLEIPPMAAFAALGLSLWHLLINAHIFRHCLEVSFGMGIVVALSYEFLRTFLVAIIGPAGGS